jgi:hypothetical protein
MKIAISASGPTLESPVDPRFGRAACFIIYDSANGQFEAHDNKQNLNAVQGAGIQAAEILFETASGQPIFMRQISGAIARRVVFEPDPGDTVRAGAIVGMIRFGSRVELFVPWDSGFEILVRQNERVRSGATVIGRPVKGVGISLKEQRQG